MYLPSVLSVNSMSSSLERQCYQPSLFQVIKEDPANTLLEKLEERLTFEEFLDLVGRLALKYDKKMNRGALQH